MVLILSAQEILEHGNFQLYSRYLLPKMVFIVSAQEIHERGNFQLCSRYQLQSFLLSIILQKFVKNKAKQL